MPDSCPTAAVPALARDPRVRYALAALLDAPEVSECPWPAWLSYGPPESLPRGPGVCIVHSGLFGSDYGAPQSLPATPLACIDGVPILYGNDQVERRGDTIVVGGDVIASAYFLLTRYEEWVRPGVRDEHGRFPGKESLPFRAGFLGRPVVDEYASLLRKWARAAGIDVPSPRRSFSVLLTHDVDCLGVAPGPFRAVRCLASGLFGRRTWREALSACAIAAGFRSDPCDNLEEVAHLDRRLTRRFPPDRCGSLYFFMAGGNSQHDGSYRLRDRWILNRLRQVVRSGAEIGLHASYEAGLNPARVGAERQALQDATGISARKNRHHYLAWREPEDGEAIAEGGIRWDATLGYADVAGFRLGVCRPVPLFDPARRCPLGIEEHPLVVMDCTLDRPNYMNLGEEAAFDTVCRLIDETHRHQGEFVCLWHNTVLASTDASYHKRLYPRVLDYLAGRLAVA